MAGKKSIVFLGYHSFPYGLAEVQKIILISKSLIVAGNDVTVVCKNGYHNQSERPDVKAQGVYEGIDYVYVSGSCFRNSGFINRRLYKLKGTINQVSFLRKRRKEKRLDYAILSTRSFSTVLYYSILSKFIGFRTILNYVEYYSAMKKKPSQIGQRFNDKLFDKYAPSLCNAVLPISEFLISRLKEVSPQKKYLKIPGLTDFEKYNGIQTLNGEKFFLFCGDAGYKEIIHFNINAFGLIKNNSSVFLYLVINGWDSDIEDLKNFIKSHPQGDRIKLFSKLPQKELFTYYKNAIGLLIPLRPTFQDIARFPHKIGEYLASGNPVISTNYGEVKFYFKDSENMFLADSYDIKQFAAKMQFVIDNPVDAQNVGKEGKKIASEIFDYRNRAKIINDFLNEKI
jgi:glycosyltransferase involved in cell wall biosynthesis